jgi:hypothetical protein
MQAALIPVAYTVGTDFRPAARIPWTRWSPRGQRQAGREPTRPAIWVLPTAMWQGICDLATGACASGTPVAAVGPAVKWQGMGRSLIRLAALAPQRLAASSRTSLTTGCSETVFGSFRGLLVEALRSGTVCWPRRTPNVKGRHGGVGGLRDT